MSDKVRQAVKEFGYTFLAVFIPAMLALVTGWELDLREKGILFPDLSVLSAAVSAALMAALLAAVKSVLWYFTGTSAPVSPR